MTSPRTWSAPTRLKFLEAIGAVADERVLVASPSVGQVRSSGGEKTYDVSYDERAGSIFSNDNSSYYDNVLGYPAVAFLLAIGKVTVDPATSEALRGIRWRELAESSGFDPQIVQANLRSLLDEVRVGSHAEVMDDVESLSAAIAELGLVRPAHTEPPPG